MLNLLGSPRAFVAFAFISVGLCFASAQSAAGAPVAPRITAFGPLAVASSSQNPLLARWHTESNKRAGYFDTRYKVPVLHGSPVADFATRWIRNDASETIQRFIRETLSEGTRPRHETTVDWSTEITMLRPNLVSTISSNYWFTGGAHPNVDVLVHNVALINGKPTPLELRHLLEPGLDPRDVASRLVLPELRKQEAMWVTNGELKRLTTVQTNRFVVTSSGLT